MSDSRLSSRARALIEAHGRATPGPWYTCGLPWFQTGSGVLAGSPDPHVGALIVDCESWDGEREEMIADHPHIKIASPDDDAAFIAIARNDAPAIAAALIEAVEIIRGLVNAFSVPCDGEFLGHEKDALDVARAWLAKQGEPT